MGKGNGTLSSDTLRQQIADLDTSIAEMREQEADLTAKIQARLLPAWEGDEQAKSDKKTFKAQLARTQYELRGKEEIRPVLEAKLADALAAEALAAQHEVAAELEMIAEAIEAQGSELDKALRTIIDAVHALEDDLSRAHRISGAGPNRELLQTGLKDLLRSQLGALYWIGLPTANKRWSGRELCGGWAAGLRGRAAILKGEQPTIPTPQPTPVPKLNGKLPPQVHIGAPLPGDEQLGGFSVHEDQAALRRSHEAAMKGKSDA